MGRILGGDALERLADGVQECIGGASFRGAEQGLDFAPHHFDRIEIGRVGWEEQQSFRQ